MQLTKSQLKQIIKEELASALTEAESINVIQIALDALKKNPSDQHPMALLRRLAANADSRLQAPAMKALRDLARSGDGQAQAALRSLAPRSHPPGHFSGPRTTGAPGPKPPIPLDPTTRYRLTKVGMAKIAGEGATSAAKIGFAKSALKWIPWLGWALLAYGLVAAANEAYAQDGMSGVGRVLKTQGKDIITLKAERDFMETIIMLTGYGGAIRQKELEKGVERYRTGEQEYYPHETGPRSLPLE